MIELELFDVICDIINVKYDVIVVIVVMYDIYLK